MSTPTEKPSIDDLAKLGDVAVRNILDICTGKENYRPANWKQSYIGIKGTEIIPYLKNGKVTPEMVRQVLMPCPMLMFPIEDFEVKGKVDYQMARPPWDSFILKSEHNALYIMFFDFKKLGYEDMGFVHDGEIVDTPDDRPAYSFVATDLTRADEEDESMPNVSWSLNADWVPRGDLRESGFGINGIKIHNIIAMFALLNCKNVEVVQTHKANAPMKIVNHRIKPKFNHHHVKINNVLIKSDKELNQKERGDGTNKRFHMCRGHFKHRQTGTFWWSPHYRGRKELGFVEQEYEYES